MFLAFMILLLTATGFLTVCLGPVKNRAASSGVRRWEDAEQMRTLSRRLDAPAIGSLTKSGVWKEAGSSRSRA